MMRLVATMTFAALLLSVAFVSTTSAQDKFEVADVHKSPPSTSTVMRVVLRGGRYELTNATMVDLVRTAYGIEPDEVFGGPSWVEFDRFDVIAKADRNTPQDDLKIMLQELLADRFGLAVHKDTKELPGVVLSIGKANHKLKEADPTGKPGCQNQPLGSLISSVGGEVRIGEMLASCRNITMEAFAADLRRLASGYFTMVVIDKTELKGSWDFDLKFTPRILGGPAPGEVSVFDAVDFLGLKLEEKKLPRSVLVIDQVNRRPTDNPPDLAKRLPALPPAEFEVATIKLVDLNAARQPIFFGMQPGGRVNLTLPLRSLFTLAWNLNLNANEEIPGLPKSMESTPYEVVGKVPAEYVPATGSGSLQDIAPMLQVLITERFKMKSHYEDRQVTAYALVAGKPKLKKADPATRTGCKSGNLTGGFTVLAGSAPPTVEITCQNITMAEFAEYLQVFGSTYVRYPVVDGTGLEGSWDFSLSFSAINPAQLAGLRAANPAGGPDAPSASDPIGGTTLFDAVEKQLGLKLETQKRAFPILVIDHIEAKPLEN